MMNLQTCICSKVPNLEIYSEDLIKHLLKNDVQHNKLERLEDIDSVSAKRLSRAFDLQLTSHAWGQYTNFYSGTKWNLRGLNSYFPDLRKEKESAIWAKIL